jgi:hypothetical protein
MIAHIWNNKWGILNVCTRIEAFHNQLVTRRSVIPHVSKSGNNGFEYRPGEYLNMELMEMEIIWKSLISTYSRECYSIRFSVNSITNFSLCEPCSRTLMSDSMYVIIHLSGICKPLPASRLVTSQLHTVTCHTNLNGFSSGLLINNSIVTCFLIAIRGRHTKELLVLSFIMKAIFRLD